MKPLSYIIPIGCAALVLVAGLTISLKCNSPRQNLLKEKVRLERKIDSLEKLNQSRIDTFYLYRTKTKIKNDTIFIEQNRVAILPADSAYQYFKQNTGATAIRD